MLFIVLFGGLVLCLAVAYLWIEFREARALRETVHLPRADPLRLRTPAPWSSALDELDDTQPAVLDPRESSRGLERRWH